jgi:hypothetical protein
LFARPCRRPSAGAAFFGRLSIADEGWALPPRYASEDGWWTLAPPPPRYAYRCPLEGAVWDDLIVALCSVLNTPIEQIERLSRARAIALYKACARFQAPKTS